MYEISEDSFEAWRRDVLESPADLTIAYFTAPWCGPCRMLKPTLEKLENENEGLTVVRVDVESNPTLQQQFNIMTVPQLFFYNAGSQVAVELGIKQKPYLQSVIDKYLGE